MADDLMDFSDKENMENLYVDDVDENVAPGHAPALLQSPVIVNSILKQNTKDNLIQLYTPVQKPVKGKLKVRFGSDSLLETPVVKGEKRSVKVPPNINEETKQPQQKNAADDKTDKQKEDEEDWIERTSVLTKQDHEDYTQIATDIVHQIVTELPVTENGIEHESEPTETEEMSPMEISECVAPEEVGVASNENKPIAEEEPQLSELDKLLLEAQECLKQYGMDEAAAKTETTEETVTQDSQQTAVETAVSEVGTSGTDAEEEPMDCDEAMEVDEITPTQDTVKAAEKVTTDTNLPATQQQDIAVISTQVKIEEAKVQMSEDTSEIDDSDIGPKPDTPMKQETSEVTKTVEEIREQTGNSQTPSEKKEESSDEEFMSADEDVEESKRDKIKNEVEKTEGLSSNIKSSDNMAVENNPESKRSSDTTANAKITESVSTDMPTNSEIEQPEMSPPKKGYSLNFDDLDQMNPFATKSAVCNSPGIGKPEAKTRTPANISNEVQEELDNCSKIENKETDKQEKDIDDRSSLPNVQTENTEIVAVKQETHLTQSSDLPEVKSSKKECVKVCTDKPEIEDSQDIHRSSDKETELKESLPTETEAKTNDTSNFDEQIPVARGTYNFDDIDFESMDPFKSSKQMVNSPDVARQSESKTENSPAVKMSKQNIKTEEVKESPVDTNKTPVEDSIPSHDNQNETETKSQETGDQQSPMLKIEQSEMTTEIENVTDTVCMENMDPFKTNCKMGVSPAKSIAVDGVCSDSLDNKDPFSTKSKVMNSPAKSTNKSLPLPDNSSCTTLEGQSESNSVEVIDPFKTESKVDNSPVKPMTASPPSNTTGDNQGLPECMEDIDPFKTTSKVANSPAVKTETKNALPDSFDVVDPFQTNSKVGNSPAKAVTDNQSLLESLDNIDPFKSNSKVGNSPAKAVTDNQSLPESLDDIDPFKSNSKVGNSPAKAVTDSQYLPESLDDIDPFKSNNKVGNSPTKAVTDNQSLDDIDPFKSTSKVGNSPAKAATDSQSLDDIDPFKSTSKVGNSPAKDVTDNQSLDDIDPFKSNSNVGNSPAKAVTDSQSLLESLDDIDPFKSKSKVGNSPAKAVTDSLSPPEAFDDIDPFKTNSEIENSPAKQKDTFEDIDPFKTVSKMVNTPDKNSSEIHASVNTDTDIDPFTTKSKVASSPVGAQIDQASETKVEDAVKTSTAEAESPENCQSDEEELQIQGVTRRGEQPVGASIHMLQNCLDFDESQFVPASEVFRDPEAWDMLEQFGNKEMTKEESSLSRMSLYVKFDPLVEAAPNNPRRISIKPSQLEKVKEYGLDETLLLLGTPPRKSRQSMNVSQRATPVELNASTKMASKPKAAESSLSAQKSKGVDLILEFSPSQENKQVEPKKGKALFPTGFSENCDFTEEEMDTDLLQELKYTDADVRRLRSEHKLEVQGILLAKGSEWQKEKESLKQVIQGKCKEIQTMADEKTKMQEVFVMYETTIRQMADKNNKAGEEIEKMKKERDQAIQDLAAVENAFSDLHRRYEKMKEVLLSMRQNEDLLKKTVAEHLEKKKTMDTSFQNLKKKAEEKIAHLSQEKQKLQKEKDEEKRSMEAKIKILQMQAESSEKTIQQKITENKQLTEICEKLISEHEQGS